jgi:hypothetical protein
MTRSPARSERPLSTSARSRKRPSRSASSTRTRIRRSCNCLAFSRRCGSRRRRSPTATFEAIAPLLKVLDRLDRYQRVAKVNQVYDDEARKKLFDKIHRVAANVDVDEARTAKAAKAAKAGGQAAESLDSGETGGSTGHKVKMSWGVGISP